MRKPYNIPIVSVFFRNYLMVQNALPYLVEGVMRTGNQISASYADRPNHRYR